MATSKSQGKRNLEEGEGKDDDDDEDGGGSGSLTCKEDERKKRGSSLKRAISSNTPSCQADLCTADMSDAKKYHKRHKVCEFHAKEPVVLVSGIYQRFCQQCSRFQELSEFDDIKKSCRKRLTEHNVRRRKNSTENQGEASN